MVLALDAGGLADGVGFLEVHVPLTLDAGKVADSEGAGGFSGTVGLTVEVEARW